MWPFRLYKRSLTKRYYACFWDSERKKYSAGQSIEVLSQKLGDEPHFGVLGKYAAFDVAKRAYESGIWKGALPTAPLFVDYVIKFWDYDSSPYVRLKNKVKPNSVGRDHCANMLGTFKKHMQPHLPKDLRLSAVTTVLIKTHILRLIDEGNIANATINKVILSIQVPLNEAFRNKLIKENPMDGIQMLARNAKEKGIPTRTEVETLLAYLYELGSEGKINLKIYLAVALAATTGMRAGEIRALKASNISLIDTDDNGLQGIIRVAESYAKKAGMKETKGKRVRHVPVSGNLALGLLQMGKSNPHGNGLIFWSAESSTTPISESYLRKEYYAGLHAIGITEDKRIERNIDFHSLRHFYNSYLRGQVDEPTLRYVIGHQSERMSDNYTHEIEEKILKVGKISEKIVKLPS